MKINKVEVGGLQFEISPGKKLEAPISTNRLDMVLHISTPAVQKAHMEAAPRIYLKNN